ncbi:MAG TPA: flagellar hook-associated protein FlgL [Pseudomonadales bacterium]|nr:flagellar hook-associated protein FlgL [Pseudomonadales bacterium]
MRISTAQIYKTGLNGVLNAHTQVGETQEKITTGKRVLRPSDDPMAAVRIQQVGLQISAAEQYNSNIDTANAKLAEEENLLDVTGDILQRIRELVIRAENGSLNQVDRSAIAAEIEERLGELYNVANSRDAAGKYIFGGFNGEQAPFVKRDGGGYLYRGDSGQNQIQFSSNSFVELNDAGKGLFTDIKLAQGGFDTRAVASNSANPPAQITEGQIVNQLAFSGEPNEQYQLTFNPLTNVVPNGPNYTVTRLSDGAVIGAPNQVYNAGDNIEINRERFEVPLNPNPGDSFLSFDGQAGEDYQIVFNAPTAIVPNGPNFSIMRKSDGTWVGAQNQPYVSGADIQFNGMRFQINGDPAVGDRFDVHYSDSQNLLSMVEQMVHSLKQPADAVGGNFSAFIANTLDNLNQAETSVVSTRVKIGARMNVGESSAALNENIVFEGTTVISKLRDLDYAKALSDLSFQTFVLEAAQKSFVKIGNLSLFNFLR